MPPRPLHVTLPADFVAMVRDKVTSGACASESKIVSAGLRAPGREEHGAADEIGCAGASPNRRPTHVPSFRPTRCSSAWRRITPGA
jgi:hypothetical protein